MAATSSPRSAFPIRSVALDKSKKGAEASDTEQSRPGGGRPGSALRVLARGDTRILIVADDRRVAARERVAHLEWCEPADAAAMARHCAELVAAAGVARETDGWCRLELRHLPGLLAAARARLDAAKLDAAGERERDAERAPRRWSAERIARLGFLVGLGWTAKMIAADPVIASTPGNIYRQAHRFGLSLSDAPSGRVGLNLPAAATVVYDRAAARANQTRDGYIRRLLIGLAADPARVAALAA